MGGVLLKEKMTTPEEQLKIDLGTGAVCEHRQRKEYHCSLCAIRDLETEIKNLKATQLIAAKDLRMIKDQRWRQFKRILEKADSTEDILRLMDIIEKCGGSV